MSKPGMLPRKSKSEDAVRAQETNSRAPSWAPNPKVAAAGASGSLSVVLVWAAGQAGIDLPPEVAVALAALIATAVGYLVPGNRL